MNEIQEQVRARYAERALTMAKTADASCCSTDCCSDLSASCGDAYSAEDLASVGMSTTASLGCGNPTLLADLKAGQTVLDLGSGAGLDVLLSARRVSPGGHAYGVDMTDEMLGIARSNQEQAGVTNATFLKGTIEAVPLPDAAVDVVLSNCVINLAADKGAVIAEAFRVLKPGGRFAVSDMIALEEMSPEAKRDLDLWAGCISGTISRDAYVGHLADAGFREIDVGISREMTLPGIEGKIASASIRATKPS